MLHSRALHFRCILLPLRSRLPAVRPLGYWQGKRHSTQLAPRPRPEDERHASIASSTRPFAIEHVDGRARHLTWTKDGRVTKEWQNIAEVSASSAAIDASQRPSRFGRVSAWLRQMFLPTNYPHSVHRSYFPYHALQFAETVVGTLVSVLCNQAMLVSVGVSAEGSIFGAVAVQWIIKDGAGEIAKLFFIRRFAPFFDSHPKTFNLIGAGGVMLGSGLQIASIIGPATTGHFLMCAAGGNIFKLIGNAVWFTTHIKFVRFFAQQGNMGDVAAKSESQASVGQLLGYAAGIGLLTFSHSAPYLYSVFAVAVPLHLVVTTWMLRVASFEMLTLPRLSWLSDDYVSRSSGSISPAGVPGLLELDTSRRTGLFGEFYKNKKDNFLRLAPQLENVLASATADERDRWELCATAFNHDRYLLYPTQKGPRRHYISVFYRPDATSDDILRSILHASALRRMLTTQEFFDHTPRHQNEAGQLLQTQRRLSVLRKSLHRSGLWTASNFVPFKSSLEDAGWQIDEIAFADHGRRVLWETGSAC